MNWKQIPGFEYYEANTNGQVRSLDRIVAYKDGRMRLFKGKVLKPTLRNDGYTCVALCVANKKNLGLVHRIIATTFIPNAGNKPNINHKDFDTTNNNVENLEWCNQKENIRYSANANRMCKGESHHYAKLSDEQVRIIRESKAKGIELARQYSVTASCISYIKNNKKRLFQQLN